MKDASEIKILVVEDDIPMRDLVKKILEKHEYRVVEAGDGEEALACLHDSPEVALIITDIR
ncbi:MAG TPA: response regulator, partial [Candidatus Sumerlaeota bacterium]|nr:response regulator [Candidatus Sumerlaeota bacterium]